MELPTLKEDLAVEVQAFVAKKQASTVWWSGEKSGVES